MMLLVRASVRRDVILEHDVLWVLNALHTLLREVAKAARVEPGEVVVFRVARGAADEVLYLEGGLDEVRAAIQRLGDRIPRIPTDGLVTLETGEIGVSLVLSRSLASVLGDLQVYVAGDGVLKPGVLARLLGSTSNELVDKTYLVVEPVEEAMNPLHDMREDRAAWWSSHWSLVLHVYDTSVVASEERYYKESTMVSMMLRVERLAATLLRRIIEDEDLWGALSEAAQRKGVRISRGSSIEAEAEENLQPLYRIIYDVTYGALLETFPAVCKCTPEKLIHATLWTARKILEAF